ncbi:MAG TPA: SMC family ATPase [Candidatus Bathyarchaeia archaeon]|nr:SMC family ATPase [Candidatus Bathyarchaeia archaeon]
MRVESIELENIRSHTKTKIEFLRGFNCLVGGVGWGKSSVLYAIDFALFGDPIGRSYDYLLREGEDSGKVSLKFVHEGKTYAITRGMRKRGKGISQDWEQLKLTQDGTTVASVKSEAVAEQLKAITGLDKDLFREIVWVRQEQLKQLLDMTPRERQKRLDELFGLSDYEVGWTNLQGIQREYEGEKKAYERDPDIVIMDKLHTEYDKAVQEFVNIEAQIDGLKKKHAEAEKTLKEATERLQGLEELRKQTEELRRNEAQLKTSIENAADNITRLADEIKQKTSNIDGVNEKLQSFETELKTHRERLKQAGLNPDQTPDELRKHLQTLEEQLRILGGEKEASRKEIQEAWKKISTLTAESKCPLCSQDLSSEYKTNLLDRLNKGNAEGEQKLAELQKSLEKLDEMRDLISTVERNMQMTVPKIEDLQNRISDEQQQLDRLSKEFEEKQLLEKSLHEKLSTVQAEITKFDLTLLDTARMMRDQAFVEFSDVKNKLETTKNRKNDLAGRMEEFKQRLDNAQEKLERKQRIEKLLETTVGVRDAYRSIQPKMRSEFVTYLQRMIQQSLDELVGGVGPALIVKVDDTYSPVVKGEEGFEREVANLSGGERTLLAFAYRLGMGQLIMQSRTGHGLYMMLLDEPTESLGPEDGSIDRLAEAVSRLKAIEQIIAVTHSEVFAEKAEHVIRVEKEAGISHVTPGK